MNAITKWRCPGCHEIHDTREAATTCCKPIPREVYVCAICHEDYMTGTDAGACCFNDPSVQTVKPNFGSLRFDG